MNRCWFWILCFPALAGCAGARSVGYSSREPLASAQENVARTQPSVSETLARKYGRKAESTNSSSEAGGVLATDPGVEPVGYQEESERTTDSSAASSAQEIPIQSDKIPEPELAAAAGSVTLDAVIGSVYQSYPLLQGALYSRNIALGEQISASGEFDLKLKGASESGPTGFYQTYRHSIGLAQPLYGGGEAFAGYRIGRGDFQPWYLERQTNDGGEFKAGVSVPLLQNVEIDARRAALWNAQYGRQLAEPEIQALLIQFVQEASYAYWGWVAAGESYDIADRVLNLAEERTSRIESQVKAGLIDPPELTDNLRLVADRRAKLADARRKLDQSAAKLSLYLRDAAGNPIVPAADQLPAFPMPAGLNSSSPDAEIQQALNQRPEIRALQWQRRQLEVEYAQAENLTLPGLDAMVSASQDMGAPTSSKRDKSEFELEAGVYLDVPIQRRKARGKIAALEGKLSQNSAKQRMVGDKIAVEVQNAWIALNAAITQVEQSQEAVQLAEELAARERQNFDAGLSDLLKVTLREQYAAESAQKFVDSLLLYYEAQADFRAALGQDSLP